MISVPQRCLAWVREKSSPSGVAVAVGALGVAVYSGALSNGFAYDDVSVVVSDPGIKSLASLPGRMLEPSWPLGSAREIGAWRPLTTGLWGVIWMASSGAAWAFHLFGILLHGFASALVVLVLASLMPLAAAAVAGIIFAVHPVHTEAVANVVGSADVLASVFILWACLVHVRADTQHTPRTVVHITLVYAFGLLAKEGAATLPALLFLIDAVRDDLRPRDTMAYLRRRAPLYVGLVSVLALVLWARTLVLGDALSVPPPLGAEVLREITRVWTVVGSWGHYVRLLLFPFDLSVDYAPALVPIAFDLTPAVISGAAQVLGLCALALVAWRAGSVASPEYASPRIFTWGVLWVAFTLIPVANILYLSPVLVSERSMYLPSVGMAAATGWLVHWMAQRHRGAAVAIALSLAVLFTGRTVDRIPTWRSTDTVFATLLAEHPESGRAQWVLANDLWTQGRRGEAMRAFQYAIGTLDSAYPVLVDLGGRLMDTPAQSSAEAVLRLAWQSDVTSDGAPSLLFAMLRRQGRLEEAVAVARTSLETVRDSVLTLDQLAVGLSGLGLHREAVDVRARALAMGRGEMWRWWVAQAEDYAVLGDRGAVDDALARARALAEREGPDALRMFGEVTVGLR